MKFKVGDKVVNRLGFKGTVQEVMIHGCIVNYGDYAEYEYHCDLQKPKKITFAQANKEAEKEKKAEIKAQELVKEFCSKLAKVV